MGRMQSLARAYVHEQQSICVWGGTCGLRGKDKINGTGEKGTIAGVKPLSRCEMRSSVPGAGLAMGAASGHPLTRCHLSQEARKNVQTLRQAG